MEMEIDGILGTLTQVSSMLLDIQVSVQTIKVGSVKNQLFVFASYPSSATAFCALKQRSFSKEVRNHMLVAVKLSFEQIAVSHALEEVDV